MKAWPSEEARAAHAAKICSHRGRKRGVRHSLSAAARAVLSFLPIEGSTHERISSARSAPERACWERGGGEMEWGERGGCK